jgi:hypothetical protein
MSIMRRRIVQIGVMLVAAGLVGLLYQLRKDRGGTAPHKSKEIPSSHEDRRSGAPRIAVRADEPVQEDGPRPRSENPPEVAMDASPTSRGVHDALLGSYATIQEEKAHILEALANGSCEATWCARARETLQYWLRTAESKVRGLTFEPIRCSTGGCWAIVRTKTADDYTLAMEAAQKAHSEAMWEYVSSIGGPDMTAERDIVVGLWVVAGPNAR